jgi:hypothetical protein
MTIRVSVKRKFIVRGKEYKSVEEMPPEIRQAYEKVLAASSKANSPKSLVLSRTRIIFDGQEYESIEAMPRDVRQAYDRVMKALETGEVPSDIIPGAEGNGSSLISRRGDGRPTLAASPRSVEPEPSFSLRRAIIGVVLLALLLGLYFLFYSGGSH